MEQKILKEIGMSDSETKVYHALLEAGDSTRGQIVQKSGIAGSKVYEVLARLQDKGLVSMYVKNKIKHFKATSPLQILNYLQEKKEQLLETEKEVSAILPNLLALYSSSKEEQEVELLSGIKGLQVLFKEQIEIMNKGEICYVIGGTRGTNEEALQSFFQKIHLLREEKGIKTKMLFNNKQKSTTENLYSSKKYKDTETRYIEHTAPVAINIYKNKTIILIFGKSISAISITSKEVAKSFIEYFELLWNQTKIFDNAYGSWKDKEKRDALTYVKEQRKGWTKRNIKSFEK